MSTVLASATDIKGALTNSEFVASYIGSGSYIPTVALNLTSQNSAGRSAIELASLNLNNEHQI